MKILLIYNPQAGHKRAMKQLPEVEAEFIRTGIDFDLQLTDYPEHADEITRNTPLKNYDGIVAAGGDGTLFEVVNGYFKNPSAQKIPLGILPMGTGNAFARDLDIETGNWRQAIEIIRNGKPRKVDVGCFRTHGQQYYYLNILGMGFAADCFQYVAAHLRPEEERPPREPMAPSHVDLDVIYLHLE